MAHPYLHDLPAPALVVDRAGSIVEMNAAAGVLLGADGSRDGSPSLVARLDRDDRQAVDALIQDAADGHPDAVRVRLVPVAEGQRVRHLDLAMHAAGTAADPAGAVLVVVTDRTDEVRAEAMLAAVADTTLLLGLNGLVEWQSSNVTEALAGTETGGIGINPLERMHPEDLPTILDKWAEAVSNEGSLIRYTARSRSVTDDDVWQLIEVAGTSQLQNPDLNGIVVQIRNLDEGVTVESVGEAEGQFQSLSDAAPIGIVMVDAYGRTVYRNAAAKSLMGQPGVRAEREWRDYVRAEFHDDLERMISDASVDGKTSTMTAAFAFPSGGEEPPARGPNDAVPNDGVPDDAVRERWIRVHVTPRYGTSRQTLGAIATLEDVTAEVAAREETARLTHMLDATSDFVAVFRPGGDILYVNAATRRLLDALAAEGRESHLRELIDDEPRRAWVAAAMEVLEHSNVWQGELELNAGGGQTVPVSALGVVRKNADGGLDWIAMLGRDITERRAAEQRLREIATHDHLTGLPNRPLFNDRLEQAIARHKRERRGVAVMFCDLDGFKAVNDERGHASGDEVLCAIADRLRAITRESDTAARVGGDEFVVVCEGVTDTDELATLAERVIEAVSQPIPLSSGVDAKVGISVGVGVARSRQENVDADSLLTLADTAMYRAKARGGNTFRIAALDD